MLAEEPLNTKHIGIANQGVCLPISARHLATIGETGSHRLCKSPCHLQGCVQVLCHCQLVCRDASGPCSMGVAYFCTSGITEAQLSCRCCVAPRRETAQPRTWLREAGADWLVNQQQTRVAVPCMQIGDQGALVVQYLGTQLIEGAYAQ